MRLFEIDNNKIKYVYFFERDDEIALDIYTFDKDKQELDGGVLETETGFDTDQAISEVLDFIGLDLSNAIYKELDKDLIEDFNW